MIQLGDFPCIITILMGLGCSGLALFVYPRINVVRFSKFEVIMMMMISVSFVVLIMSLILMILSIFQSKQFRRISAVLITMLGFINCLAMLLAIYMCLNYFDPFRPPKTEAWILATVVIAVLLSIKSFFKLIDCSKSKGSAEDEQELDPSIGDEEELDQAATQEKI